MKVCKTIKDAIGENAAFIYWSVPRFDLYLFIFAARSLLLSLNVGVSVLVTGNMYSSIHFPALWEDRLQ